MLLVPLERHSHGKFGLIKKLRQNEPDLALSLSPAGDMRSGSDQRRSLLLHMPLEPARLYSLHQVHSHKVFTTGPEINGDIEGDGLVAGDPSHVLAVSVADCMPIFLFHAATRRFALVHSGWKGTGIALRALKLLKAQSGLKAADFTAVLGPSIRNCCYQVDEERAASFSADWGGDSVVWRAAGFSGTAGHTASTTTAGAGRAPYLDLLQANLSSLQKAGVQDIRYVDECTACTADLGSFRREGPQQFTHMLAMIGYFK